MISNLAGTTLFFAGMICCTMAIAQCPGAVGDAATASPPTKAKDAALGEQKFVLVEEKGNVRPLFYVKAGKLAIFEGDIVLGDADEIERLGKLGPISYNSDDSQETLHPFALAAKSVLTGRRRWSNATVPYEIADGLQQADDVRAAIAAWANVTPVHFVERTNTNAASYPNYVKFIAGTDANACLSDYLGMHGGQQYVRLVSGCGFGQIAHEIGHVLGLDHEQNWADRNAYVRINFQNIPSSPQEPKLFRRDNTKIIRDRVSEFRPSPGDLHTQKI